MKLIKILKLLLLILPNFQGWFYCCIVLSSLGQPVSDYNPAYYFTTLALSIVLIIFNAILAKKEKITSELAWFLFIINFTYIFFGSYLMIGWWGR